MTATIALNRGSRARWLARRRKGITATDVPAILGLSPWKSPLGVWLDKVAPEDEPPTYPMLRGLALEQTLADEWARQSGEFVTRPPMLLAHPEHPWLLASLDRVAHGSDRDRVLELKTGTDWTEWADGNVPDHYAAQVLVQLAVTGLDEGIVFADVAGRLETRRIPRDLGWESAVIPELRAWWDDYVVARTPPPLHEWRDFPLLNRVWVPEPGTEVDATDAVMGAVNARHALKAKTDTLTRLIDGLKTQVRAGMGTATALNDPTTGRRVASLTRAGALRFDPLPTPTEGPTP